MLALDAPKNRVELDFHHLSLHHPVKETTPGAEIHQFTPPEANAEMIENCEAQVGLDAEAAIKNMVWKVCQTNWQG